MHIVAVNLNLESEFLKLALDFIVCQMFSKSLLKPCKAYVDLRSLQLLHIVIAESGHFQFRIKFHEIVHGKGKGLITSLRINGFLISGGRLRTCIIAQRRTTDPGSLKVGNLKDYPLCLGKDGILGSAHDSCKRNRSLGIRDHKIIVAEREFVVI